MPGRSRSKTTSVSPHVEKTSKSGKNGKNNNTDSHADGNSVNTQEKNVANDEPLEPATTNRPGTKEQPLHLPGFDRELIDVEKVPPRKEYKSRDSKRSHSKSSRDEVSSQGVDIAKILKQQTEILSKLFKARTPAAEGRAGPTQPSPPVTMQANPDSHQADPIIPDGDGQGPQPNNSNPPEPGAQGPELQDDGLVAALNLAFKVDPNSGNDIDPQVAQFIENCINLPSALDWEDMKIIRDIYKRPGNCPSVGVPSIPDAFSGLISPAGKSRDQAFCFQQSWVMASISAMGKIATDLKPFEMSEEVAWVRPVYVKVLDVIRMLSHLSVNEISKRRKEEIKIFLPKTYKKLANPKQDKAQIQLFGEELNEDVRGCEEEAKMTNKMKSMDFYQGRINPYKKPRNRGRSNYGTNNRQYGYWQNQNQNQQVHQFPLPPPSYQGFPQGHHNPGPPHYQFQPRPYHYRGRGQRRRGAKQ